MNILLLFLGFIMAFIIVIYYERKMKNVINEKYKNKNKVRFYVTQDYGVHCLKLWMGKPELSEKLLWVSCSEHVRFLCDDFRCGNSNLFENYNLNPNDFSDMKEGEIREVFINLED